MNMGQNAGWESEETDSEEEAHLDSTEGVDCTGFLINCYVSWTAAPSSVIPGGWKDRTTVEHMDLAVRASLKGWKFLFIGDLEVKNGLPSTFKAYRFQQHRWSCGPANKICMTTTPIPNKHTSTKSICKLLFAENIHFLKDIEKADD